MKKLRAILTTGWVALGSLLIFVHILCRVLFWGKRGVIDRTRADSYCHELGRRLLDLARVERHVHSKLPPLPEGRAVMLMSNHLSHYDIPLIFEATPGTVRMLGKKGLGSIPVFGYLMRKNQFVFIDRHNRPQAIEDLKKARTIMESGVKFWVAPEGTRSRNATLMPFKKGVFNLAIDTQAVIVPMAIQGTQAILAPDHATIHRGQHVSITFGQVIDTLPFGEDRDALLLDVRQAIQDLLRESA